MGVEGQCDEVQVLDGPCERLPPQAGLVVGRNELDGHPLEDQELALEVATELSQAEDDFPQRVEGMDTLGEEHEDVEVDGVERLDPEDSADGAADGISLDDPLSRPERSGPRGSLPYGAARTAARADDAVGPALHGHDELDLLVERQRRQPTPVPFLGAIEIVEGFRGDAHAQSIVPRGGEPLSGAAQPAASRHP
jgi:hypothetical protein